MSSQWLLLPAPYFPDPSTNEPITDGTVYVGNPNTDPTIEANRITVTLVDQEGNEVSIAPASQPLSIGSGGMIMYQGSPVAAVGVTSNFSMTVLRSDDTQAYYFPAAGVPDLLSNIQDNTYHYLTNVAGTNVITAEADPTLTAYAVGQVFQFLPAASNTAATTLNIDGLGAGSITLNGSALGAGDLSDGVPAEVMVTSAAPAFALLATGAMYTPGNQPPYPDAFPSGTRMIFNQTAAPTGWTKETDPSYDNIALRVVVGTISSGGGDAFTDVFGAAIETGSHVLLEAEIPAHNHAISSSEGIYLIEGAGVTAGAALGTYNNSTNPSKHTGSTGGDGGHTHTMTMDLSYVDVIIATKD